MIIIGSRSLLLLRQAGGSGQVDWLQFGKHSTIIYISSSSTIQLGVTFS